MSLGKPVVLVTGASGQLGTAVVSLLEKENKTTVLAYDRRTFDIANSDVYSNFDVIPGPEPNCVVNCAAFTEVALANREPAACWRTNAAPLKNLSAWCRRKDATLIHISTDHVFGREWPRAVSYDEQDAVGPVNEYGCSKLAGEYEILKAHVERPFKYFILRTAGMFDMPWPKHSKNFPHTIADILSRSAGTAIEVVDDVRTNLTRAEDLARAVAWFVARPVVIPHGIYHVTNPGEMSWADVSRVIANRVGGEITNTTKEKWWLTRGGDPEQVPSYTCLDLRKYQEAGGPELPPIGKVLEDWCSVYQENIK